MSFTAGLDGVVFYSHGSKLLGGFYRAAGETPRPTVILLHGVPGVEKNLDLAYALRDAGWNCLYFHYGCTSQIVSLRRQGQRGIRTSRPDGDGLLIALAQ